MKLLSLLLLAALSLGAQTPPAAPKKGPSNQPSPEAGDDVRGYNDTPQLPGQKWRVHDMDRPRPAKVTPAPVRERDAALRRHRAVRRQGPLAMDATGPRRRTQEPKWKVENGYIEIVPRTGTAGHQGKVRRLPAARRVADPQEIGRQRTGHRQQRHRTDDAATKCRCWNRTRI